MDRTARLSIVTATLNAAGQVPGLLSSLRAQTDRNFEWVVADGASSDGTLALLQSVTDLNIVIRSQPDFGTYDGLNHAIQTASGHYYIVVGADDRLAPDAVANYRRAIIDSGADIVAARVRYGDRIMQVKRGPVWLHGQFALIAAHSVATAIRRDLHARYGDYTRRFPIAADQYFIIRACAGGASRHEAAFIAGEFGTGGVSSIDRIGNATEVFRVQLATGRSFFVQTLLLLLRLLRAR
ncbi:MAG TPA: glycosyltransferase [Gallionellaceae bacterium]|nr:glycosyltransferase [Gallionellaceae bacterium]